MLERGARCVNHGGRKQLSSKDPLQSRRMLHSAFWRHGAGDLQLPPWHLSSMKDLFEPLCPRAAGDGGEGSSSAVAGSFLDFLYPDKTKAFLYRLSMQGLRARHKSKSRAAIENNLRGFMSAAGSKQDVSTRTPTSFESEVDTRARKKLENMITQHSNGQYLGSGNEAWQLWSSIKSASKTPGLTQGMIHLLASSSGTLHARRAVRLFKGLSSSDVWPSTYLHVISAHIQLQEIGKAVSLHESSVQAAGADLSRNGSDILLAHLISNHQWQLTLHVWNNCHESPAFRDDASTAERWQNNFFQKVLEVPRISKCVVSLLEMLQKYPEAEPRQEFSLSGVFSIKALLNEDVSFEQNDLERVVTCLDSRKRASRKHFEIACHRAVKKKEDGEVLAKDNAMSLFNLYLRSNCYYPSGGVLHTLIRICSNTGDLKALSQLSAEWTRYLPPPHKTITILLMTAFARAGHLEKVQSLLSKHLETRRDEIDAKVFQPLLHCHALLGNPKAIEAGMERMREEFGIIPNVHCWHCLIHAYQRTDNLEKAMECLSALEDAKIQPNNHVIATLAAAAADRGDIDQVEQLEKVARFYGIPKSIQVADALVLAHLRNDNTFDAERVALQSTREATDQGSVTRMWNQIIAHYAVDRPPNCISNAIRITKSMTRLGVKLDSLSIAALMRAFTTARKVMSARRVFHKYLGEGKLPVLPLHYAILIDGLANQQQFEIGLGYHAEMLRYGLKPDINTQVSLLKLQVMAAQHGMGGQHHKTAGFRLDVAEETLEDILRTSDISLSATKQPIIGTKRFTIAEVQPAKYYDLLLTVYGKGRAYDVVKTLLEKYTQRVAGEANVEQVRLPFRFLYYIMDIHYRQRDHDQLQLYWELSKAEAVELVQLYSNPNAKLLPAASRTILAQNLNIYLRALAGQGRFDDMSATVQDLFSRGFDLDNSNWNWYVQLQLTEPERLKSTFELCERVLMPAWQGWHEAGRRVNYYQAAGRHERGLEYMGAPGTFLPRGQVHLRYKTMVQLAKTLQDLADSARTEPDARRRLEEIQRVAPETVRAVQGLPLKLQPSGGLAGRKLRGFKLWHKKEPKDQADDAHARKYEGADVKESNGLIRRTWSRSDDPYNPSEPPAY